MADLIIKNFQYPRNDDGTFVKEHYGLESSFVITIFADDKTGKITVRPWSAGRCGLKEEYEAMETKEE